MCKGGKGQHFFFCFLHVPSFNLLLLPNVKTYVQVLASLASPCPPLLFHLTRYDIAVFHYIDHEALH